MKGRMSRQVGLQGSERERGINIFWNLPDFLGSVMERLGDVAPLKEDGGSIVSATADACHRPLLLAAMSQKRRGCARAGVAAVALRGAWGRRVASGVFRLVHCG
ncbi:MAG: hypothetical protein DWQ34_14060 [Planctomycetota bacterium]|nr:MAG: hypothetical protein DWQ34_14060 [Planctomycetota bacterium]REK23815.1 MAG: hypothetical protein DWQ41_16135 [Planctomycetota bacterium]REK32892.1 MAG: hypothetical protein DWQ45_16260 [Planctomycetota bacterium]